MAKKIGDGLLALNLETLCENLVREGRLLPEEASLFSSAPDLLKAAKLAMERISEYDCGDQADAYLALCAAISKAEDQ